jgi:hypothetical protein
VAEAAAAIGEDEWARDAAELAGGGPEDPKALPVYRDVALAGLDLVEALAADGRWDEAERQARHLTRYFMAARPRLHAVAGHGFDGLRAAARARDPEGVDDFADLLRELFAS